MRTAEDDRHQPGDATEVVRRAIATEYKLATAVEEGARILIEWPRGRVLELDLDY